MGATGFDVIVVGGGSCGSVLAARLSEDPARSVLLLERGGGRAPAAPPWELPHERGAAHVRRYPARLGRSAPGRLVRGAGIGGSGAINGAYFVRATRADLDGWPEPWSYAAALPYFRRSEADADFPGGPVHGGGGPIPVRRRFERQWQPLTARFVGAARAVGFGAEPDKNAGGPAGVGPVPGNIDAAGLRADPAAAYLTDAVLARPNLTVRTRTAVRRVMVRGGRAAGVEVVVAAPMPDARFRGGPAEAIGAGAVVLSAGAIESPALLWRSGLADPQRPRPFSDHPEITIPFTPSQAVAAGFRGAPAAPLLEATLNIDAGSADEAGPPGAAAALAAGDLSGAVEIRPYTAAFAAIGVALMTPPAGGNGVLRAAPPGDAAAGGADTDPIIEYRYFGDPAEAHDARAAVRTTRALLAASGIGEAGEPQRGTSQHLSGTCPMGTDPDSSTVDPSCRVHGTEDLWIVDTSVFPRVPSRGPHATAVMLAERAADVLREDGR